MKEHIVNFLEVPNAAFSGLPPCPFVKKARLENKIKYIIFDLSQDLTEIINSYPETYEIYLIISPTDISVKEIYNLVDKLNDTYKELEFFGGHPEDPFQVNGVFTRQEPFPNIVVQSKTILEKARLKLKKH